MRWAKVVILCDAPKVEALQDILLCLAETSVNFGCGVVFGERGECLKFVEWVHCLPNGILRQA